MRVHISYPYKADAKGNFFPVVSLALCFKSKKRDFYALVDSGATVSIFKQEVAESLGVDIEAGEEIYLGGVGGHIRGYLHKIKVEIAGKTFTCPIVFSREYSVSFSLLGRQGFFEKFDVLFEERKGQVQLV